MKKILIAFCLLVGLPVMLCAQRRPNIIIILADDMGYSDPGCFGGEIHTPNLDYLAAHGLRFTQFYNISRCCPSRASILTGLYPQQAGIGEMTTDRHVPGYRGFLTENTVTLAEVLRSAGYHTGMCGKWHVSNTVEEPDQLAWLAHQKTYPTFSPLSQYPVNRGFEKFYGTIWGVVDYYDPFSLVNGTEPVQTVPDRYYHTDAINDSAAAYIRAFSREGGPFFLYVAENAPHWPLMALPEDIAKYKDTYTGGWDAIREARYQRMVAMGIADPITEPLSPRWGAQLSWSGNPTRDWDASAMAVHAAMVDRMDQGIGRIIQALRETGQLDNTLLLFLSDNGASAENAADYGPGFDRPGETRKGEKIVYATAKQVPPGPETTYSSIGPRWANVANTPFRYWKAESYEGGVHTPLIAFWPKGLTAPPGSITHQMGHIMDFMATVVELSGGTYPKSYKGHAITPTESLSLVPIFRGQQRNGHEALFNEHYGARYVRTGEWKMTSLAGDSTWHLYHILTDQTELHDVAATHPEVVQRLEGLWREWAVKNKVLPKGK